MIELLYGWHWLAHLRMQLAWLVAEILYLLQIFIYDPFHQLPLV